MRAPYAIPLMAEGKTLGVMKVTEKPNGVDIGIRILPQFITVHFTLVTDESEVTTDEHRDRAF